MEVDQKEVKTKMLPFSFPDGKCDGVVLKMQAFLITCQKRSVSMVCCQHFAFK